MSTNVSLFRPLLSQVYMTKKQGGKQIAERGNECVCVFTREKTWESQEGCMNINSGGRAQKAKYIFLLGRKIATYCSIFYDFSLNLPLEAGVVLESESFRQLDRRQQQERDRQRDPLILLGLTISPCSRRGRR